MCGSCCEVLTSHVTKLTLVIFDSYFTFVFTPKSWRSRQTFCQTKLIKRHNEKHLQISLFNEKVHQLHVENKSIITTQTIEINRRTYKWHRARARKTSSIDQGSSDIFYPLTESVRPISYLKRAHTFD